MDADALLADLDPDQRAAVTADSHLVAVIAGAGSGKTRVLTRRIAWRIATEQALIDDNGDGLYDRREYLASVLNTNTGPGTSVMIIGGTDRGSLVPVSGFVGPVTNPDPMYTLILRLAEATGTVAYSPPDSDGDGWYDHEDARPSDPYRH